MDRPSSDPHVERVWTSRCARGGRFQSIAAATWELVLSRVAGRVTVHVRGPETKATRAECPAEGEWLAVRFALGTGLASLGAADAMDRRDVVLASTSRGRFQLNGSSYEFPSFENVETFVRRLVRAGELRRDPLVADLGRGRGTAFSRRTEQRRFRHVTGLTPSLAYQIVRARRAAFHLRQGWSTAAVMELAGYYDQAHLNRAMRRWVGGTPGSIARGEEQLSFLYNTPGP